MRPHEDLADRRLALYLEWVDIGPHRAPALAALARRAHLLSRIEDIDPDAARRALVPFSLPAILSENLRLAEILAVLERGAVVSGGRDSADDELAPVVHDDGPANADDVPLDRHRAKEDHRRRVLLTLGVLVPVALLVFFAQRALEQEPSRAVRPPREAKTVRLTGVVVSRAGTIEARPGERCEVTIADSGDRERGRTCHIEVRCPHFNQGFNAASCPIGEPNGPVRMRSNGIEIDEVARTAAFIAGRHGEVIEGGATLHLDTAR